MTRRRNYVACVGLMLAVTAVFASPGTMAGSMEHDVLAEVQRLYALSEDEAIDRLAREDEAASLALAITPSIVASFAGSWFDGDTLGLKVAIADRQDYDLVRQLGGDPVLVRYALSDLEAAYEDLVSSFDANSRLQESVTRVAINLQSNTVEVDLLPSSMEERNSVVAQFSRTPDMLTLRNSEMLPTLSSGVLRGAIGTRNLTGQDNTGGIWPCSVGFPVLGGYITAGHCGSEGDHMGDASGQSLGLVEQSEFRPEDRGWVITGSGWTPVPQIDGYSDGIINIPAAWSGYRRALVGSTVWTFPGFLDR